jgi:transcriptional regulator with XRE-family HTH domain
MEFSAYYIHILRIITYRKGIMNGSKLKEIRQMLRLYQTDIAEYMGVDNETVCRWECGNKELSKVQSAAVEALMVAPDEVSGLRGSRKRRRQVARKRRYEVADLIPGEAIDLGAGVQDASMNQEGPVEYVYDGVQDEGKLRNALKTKLRMYGSAGLAELGARAQVDGGAVMRWVHELGSLPEDVIARLIAVVRESEAV